MFTKFIRLDGCQRKKLNKETIISGKDGTIAYK